MHRMVIAPKTYAELFFISILNLSHYILVHCFPLLLNDEEYKKNALISIWILVI